MAELTETWRRIRAANDAAGWAGWPLAERDQIEALADDLNRELRFTVVHAWATRNGSQLTFWCRYCKTHHVHGRHHGPETVDHYTHASSVASEHPDSPVSERMWREYLSRFGECTYSSWVPGGFGICTCPVGSADGHRVAHCWNTQSPYWATGYRLHEVPANDVRALRKPPGRRPSPR